MQAPRVNVGTGLEDVWNLASDLQTVDTWIFEELDVSSIAARSKRGATMELASRKVQGRLEEGQG